MLWFMSGGHTGDELQLDNVFFWREKPVIDAIETVVVPNNPTRITNTGIFTLDGRKVSTSSNIQEAQLRSGIYIVRTTNGVRKVVIR
jgi:hypothetical protein